MLTKLYIHHHTCPCIYIYIYTYVAIRSSTLEKRDLENFEGMKETESKGDSSVRDTKAQQRKQRKEDSIDLLLLLVLVLVWSRLLAG